MQGAPAAMVVSATGMLERLTLLTCNPVLAEGTCDLWHVIADRLLRAVAHFRVMGTEPCTCVGILGLAGTSLEVHIKLKK